VVEPRAGEQGHFPAIDVNQSISRVRGDVCDPDQLRAARRVLALLATYSEVEDLVTIGAYVPGANLDIDLAVQARPKIVQFLQQEPTAPTDLGTARQQLLDLTTWIEQMEKALKAQASKSPAPARK
jgi:flagellum-specific ATP synthase